MSKRSLRWLCISGALLVALIALFQFAYRPWQRTWGATAEEVLRGMPGDEIVANPTFNATRAVEIRARPEEVWPWIVQIGFRKAGFYSHDWLDNDRIPSAEEIILRFQNLRVGDTIPLSQTAEARIEILEPNEFMLLVVESESAGHETWTWAWGLYRAEPNTTRLVTRLRVELDSSFSNLYLDAFEIVMMSKCLRGIKGRVENTES
jgi:hypothetical protein